MGTLYVVGLGPGGARLRTPEATEALMRSEAIGGYSVYIDLVREEFPEKAYFSTPMRGEIARCRMALERAAAGETVSLICSGDAGVYGMAGPVLALLPEYPGVEVEVLPGITAALAGAAVLGAPLTNDFCVVSLSDLLTPWEVIERRLEAAALGELVLVLYNPASHRRQGHLTRTVEILLSLGREADTPCGYVRNIGREGEEAVFCTLAELAGAEVDMFTTVFSGNARTRMIGGRMVTERGYAEEEPDGILRRFAPQNDREEEPEEILRRGAPQNDREEGEEDPEGILRRGAPRNDRDEEPDGILRRFAPQNDRGDGEEIVNNRGGRLLIFGGTTEGRVLAEELAGRIGTDEPRIYVSVATPAGAEELAGIPHIRILVGRRNEDAMQRLFAEFDLVVDATHPYAVEASRNIRAAAARAKVRCLRLLRGYDRKENATLGSLIARMPSSITVAGEAAFKEKATENVFDTGNIFWVDSVAEAAAFLAKTDGNILVTTGAKELAAFSELSAGRVHARVLPTEDGIAACKALGLPMRNILALRGPFSEAMNLAMLRDYDISWLVTKDGGREGGFAEKLAAANAADVGVVAVRRPEEQGQDYSSVLAECGKVLGV